MAKDSGGGTLKIDDQYLEDFAGTQIKQFLASMDSDPSISAVEQFGNGSGSGTGAVAGDYSKLLAGGGTMNSATNLQANFKALCLSLSTMVKSLGSQLSKAQLELKTVQLTLQNAEDDALTAAQMMTVLNDVLSGLGGSSTTTPSTTTPST